MSWAGRKSRRHPRPWPGPAGTQGGGRKCNKHVAWDTERGEAVSRHPKLCWSLSLRSPALIRETTCLLEAPMLLTSLCRRVFPLGVTQCWPERSDVRAPPPAGCWEKSPGWQRSVVAAAAILPPTQGWCPHIQQDLEVPKSEPAPRHSAPEGYTPLALFLNMTTKHPISEPIWAEFSEKCCQNHPVDLGWDPGKRINFLPMVRCGEASWGKWPHTSLWVSTMGDGVIWPFGCFADSFQRRRSLI